MGLEAPGFTLGWAKPQHLNPKYPLGEVMLKSRPKIHAIEQDAPYKLSQKNTLFG